MRTPNVPASAGSAAALFGIPRRLHLLLFLLMPAVVAGGGTKFAAFHAGFRRRWR
jgi:hypothetical protein